MTRKVISLSYPTLGGYAVLALIVATIAAVLVGIPACAHTSPTPSAAPKVSCTRTFVGIGHQDDDLLFINPTIRSMIQPGCFLTTVYLTAGDAGKDLRYVATRETGARAAYAAMAKTPDAWTQDDVEVGNHHIASYTLKQQGADVRLTFLRLPDGMPTGKGTPQYGNQSLLALFKGTITKIVPLDAPTSPGYSEDDLVNTLTELLKRGNVSQVLTQDYDNISFGYDLSGKVDHSDHGIAARYVRQAAYRASTRLPVQPYLGYNLSNMPSNLTSEQITEKTGIFNEYNRLDSCYSALDLCPIKPIEDFPDYSNWIKKQYLRTHRSPQPGEIMSDIGSTGTDASNSIVEQCLARRTTGTPAVETRPCDNTKNQQQQWIFRDQQIIAKSNNLCLAANSGEPPLTLAPCYGTPGQKWSYDADRHIRSHVGTCLFQPDFAGTDTQLRLTNCVPNLPEIGWRLGNTQ
jgi:hypothetical protein